MAAINVLLIDDDADARDALARNLRIEAGFLVTECSNGPDALKLLEAQTAVFTAILLDFVLAPPMTGGKVLEQIRSKHPHVPVIVFTGRDPVGGLRALEMGAYRYLRRPIDEVEMISIV